MTAVDPSAGTVTLADGEEVGYDRLVLASGSAPRRLGVPGEQLEGVFTYRTLDDALGVRDAARRPGGRSSSAQDSSGWRPPPRSGASASR